MAVEREGTFRAMVIAHSVGKTSKTGLPQFVVEVALSEWYDPRGKEWYSYLEHNATMRNYMVLVNRDGALNDINYRQIKEAFPQWSGQTFDDLANGAYKGNDIVVQVAEDTYEGKTSLKIKGLRHCDWVPGLMEADASTVSDLNTRFGHLLRAQPQATPAVAPKPLAPPPPPKTMPQTSVPPPATKEAAPKDETKIAAASDELIARFGGDKEKAADEATKRAGMAAKAYDAEGQEFWTDVSNHIALPF